MLEKIDLLKDEALAAIAGVADAQALEQVRIKYLGSKGAVKGMMAWIKDVPKGQKRDFGQAANAAQKAVQDAFESRKSTLAQGVSAPGQAANGPLLDITEPATAPVLGRRHIISQTIDELIEVFARMGFDHHEGPEVEDDRHNFIALNIPDTHPARDPLDNFYLSDPFGPSPVLLRSQTSTVQIRTMEDAVARGWGPPIKIVSPGRVYRPDTVDATHSFMFHQLEGLYIDRDVSMVDLKTTLMQFATAYFSADAEVRLRPSFFPFTEPSAEFDMKIALKPDADPDWVELGGCGMVDPNVLQACGIDPEEWTGFAFGFGIERIAMGKYGIPDIRMLFDNDVRFLGQL